MLPNLKDLPINETFGGVLHTSNQAVSGSDFKQIYDGFGNPTPLSVSKNAVKIGEISYPTELPTNGSALIYDNGVATFKSLLNSVYPVGSIYLSINASTPASIFGGVWQQIGQGRFLVGVGVGVDSNSFEKTFTAGNNRGEYKHTLTTEEIPSHKHTAQSFGGSLPFLDDNGNQILGSRPVIEETQIWAVSGELTTSTGNNQPHENTPPSFGVYMWQRTS